MKQIFILFFILGSLCISAQNVKYPPKFFSLKGARIGVGVGLSFLPNTDIENGQNSAMKYIGTSTQIPYSTYDTFPSSNIIVGIDLYAPNSFLSLCSDISFQTYNFNLGEQGVEKFKAYNLNLPLSLKMKFGATNKRGHIITMLGAGYTFPLSVVRTNDFTKQTIEDNSEQLKGSWFAEGMLAYEWYLNKDLDPLDWEDYRIRVFFKYNYRLTNQLNNNHDFKYTSNKSYYSTFDLKEAYPSIGISFHMRPSTFLLYLLTLLDRATQ